MAAFFHRVNSLAPRGLREAHPEVKRFIKFMIVGGFGAILDFTILNVLIAEFHVPNLYANIISTSCAVLSNFIWNRFWTYPESRQHALHTQFGKFALVNAVGVAINTVVFSLTDNFIFIALFHFPTTLSLNLGKACAIGVVLFWNFGINRFWTYRHVEFGQVHKHGVLEDEIPPL